MRNSSLYIYLTYKQYPSLLTDSNNKKNETLKLVDANIGSKEDGSITVRRDQ